MLAYSIATLIEVSRPNRRVNRLGSQGEPLPAVTFLASFSTLSVARLCCFRADYSRLARRWLAYLPPLPHPTTGCSGHLDHARPAYPAQTKAQRVH
ncbi:MAG: hypothetical protein ACRYG7_20675 [Janthinobacterium lividum]